MNVILSIVVGLLFAGCGVSYKISERGQATTLQNASVLSVFGAIVFAILGRNQWSAMSWPVLLTGAIFGITQYWGVWLLRKAFRFGPLSPAWCAQSLNFIPVILYASIVLDEALSPWQYGAISATAFAIIAAASGATGGSKADTLHAKLVYGILLAAILLSTGVVNVGLKFCSVHSLAGHSQTMIQESGDLIMCFSYVFMGILSAVDLTLHGSWHWNRYAWTGGLMLAVFAVSGYIITLCVVDKLPAAVLFVLCNAVSILGASLLSTFFLKEKRSAAWYLTVCFSLLAILLNH